MWLCVLFDLPVLSPQQRHAYSVFRRKLKKDGFTMLQYSVYVRHCASGENAEVHIGRVKEIIPPEGLVSVLSITDKQYNTMITFWGRRRKPNDPAPQQIEMF